MDIDTGVATFLPEQGLRLDVSAVEKAVDEAGFELLWLEVEAVGTLARAEEGGQERAALTVLGTGQRFLLNPGDSPEEREGYARLILWLDQPERRVVVLGRAHSHSDASPALTVREFRVQG